MIKKAFLIFTFVFTLQLISSCIRCDCGESQTLSVEYYDVNVTAYNTAGFHDEIVKDTIFKNALGLSITVDFNLEKIANLNLPKSSIGFSYAMAWSCDCPSNKMIYNDPLKTIKIYVTNVSNQETLEITDKFSIFDYYEDKLITLDEFFSKREEWQDGFQFELTNFESIPNSAIFKVEAYLESGIMFSKETKKIDFFQKKAVYQ